MPYPFMVVIWLYFDRTSTFTDILKLHPYTSSNYRNVSITKTQTWKTVSTGGKRNVTHQKKTENHGKTSIRSYVGQRTLFSLFYHRTEGKKKSKKKINRSKSMLRYSISSSLKAVSIHCTVCNTFTFFFSLCFVQIVPAGISGFEV